MTEFNLDKYQTCLELYNEPSIEDEENYEPFLFYIKSKNFASSDWCDNLENIIKSEMWYYSNISPPGR